LVVFISDSTYTLIKRFLAGEKWYRAHNSHSYQRLVQLGLSHDKLAFFLLFINLFVVSPVAIICMLNPQLLLPINIVSYLGSFIIWLIVQKKYNKSIAEGESN